MPHIYLPTMEFEVVPILTVRILPILNHDVRFTRRIGHINRHRKGPISRYSLFDRRKIFYTWTSILMDLVIDPCWIQVMEIVTLDVLQCDYSANSVGHSANRLN